MRYVDFRAAFNKSIVFSCRDMKKMDPSFYPSRLSEWQKKGYIKKLIRGYYYFSDAENSEKELFYIANQIYKPSYISLEMALSWYNLIPEAVYGMTSVTTRRTYLFKTPIASFSYRTMSPSMFFGYRLMPIQNVYYSIAEKEKAILDYCYLNTHIKSEEDFLSLRINREEFCKGLDRVKLKSYLRRFSTRALEDRIAILLKVVDNA